MQQFFEDDIVRVANLDPELSENPNYIPLVVLGIHKYLMYRYTELHVPDPQAALEHFNTKIALQTTSPEVAFSILRLTHKSYLPIPTTNGHLKTYVFDLKDIKRLEREYPEVNKIAERAVAQGFWFFQRISAHPLKF